MKRPFIGLLLFLYLVLSCAVGTLARSLQETMERVVITMKPAVTEVNTPFRVPVYLATPTNQRLGSLTFEVVYPKDILSLLKAERGWQLQPKDFTLETEVFGHFSQSELEVLQLTISSQEESGEKPAIPAGLVLYLHFIVPEGVELFGNERKGEQTNQPLHESVTLRSKVLETETTEGKPLRSDELRSEDQIVTILSAPAPIPACFFYMH